mmetsp:Transcript_39336/g.77400  ORF Transcript_39336/g.77400 Transcript_39336/m.77400 type:complete len:121 (-) Transcript_39336:2510-2872(-)
MVYQSSKQASNQYCVQLTFVVLSSWYGIDLPSCNRQNNRSFNRSKLLALCASACVLPGCKLVLLFLTFPYFLTQRMTFFLGGRLCCAVWLAFRNTRRDVSSSSCAPACTDVGGEGWLGYK